MICPKCQYEANESDPDVMPGVCPACGIAYAKYQSYQSAIDNVDEERIVRPKQNIWRRLYFYLCFMPSDRHESAFWGHGMIFVIFLIWGWSFILAGVSWEKVGGSFLHNANLPFHEYGHVVFSMFGDFIMLLGGSMFQIIVPLACMFFFIIKQRDNFAASIMLWWSGQNFIDISPYIADAPIRALPLVGNKGPGSHDWWNILSMTGQLDLAGFYAGFCFFIGALILIVSNVWGAHLLWIEAKGRIGQAHNPKMLQEFEE